MNLSTVSRIPPPRKLGRYEVGAKIAGGGMASVYLGRDVDDRGHEQLVALKVIKDELANDPHFIHMFLDEAAILSKLSHPNIIRTLEFGVSGQHRFIAMELLLGRSLLDVWDVCFATGRKLSFGLIAWIAARVCEGLHYAHELTDGGHPLHVIHRDVNPSNIFLTYDGETKLIDFGLAKAVGRQASSVEGIVKGKIPYLSPEQIRQVALDRRADVYALGITLWECITVQRLFKRDTDIATLRAIRECKVPDARTLSECPDAMWEIVKRALAEDRDERYATAAELGKALDGFLKTQTQGTERRKELEALLGELFRGERPKQQAWLEEARDHPLPNMTMPPPAPLPSVPPVALAAELKAAAKEAAVEEISSETQSDKAMIARIIADEKAAAEEIVATMRLSSRPPPPEHEPPDSDIPPPRREAAPAPENEWGVTIGLAALALAVTVAVIFAMR